MKNRLLTVAIFALSIIATYVYARWTCIPQNSNTICANYSLDDISKLNIDLVHEMIEGYRKNQLMKINVNTFEDAVSMDLPIKQVNEFVNKIELITKSKRPKINVDSLGIRIYYAAYPKKDLWQNKYDGDLAGFLDNPITKQFGLKHNLVMVPTILTKDGVIADFDPENELTYDNGIVGDPEYFHSNQRMPALTFTPQYMNTQRSNSQSGQASSMAARNHGGLIPPGSNSGSGFNGI